MTVRLERLKHADISGIIGWLRQAPVALWWHQESSQTDDMLHKKYTSYIDHPFIKAYIITTNHQPIGYLQMYDVTRAKHPVARHYQTGTYGIDLFIGEPWARGRGYATQALQVALAYCWQSPTIHSIIVDPAMTNIQAIKCFLKAGFQKTSITLDDHTILEIKRTKSD